MLLRLTLAFAGTAAAVAAQATITVPNNAALAPYIAAAAPGDTLLLGASHPPFTLNKGLNVVGNGTAIVPPPGGTTWVQIPAGQHASLHGITFATNADPITMTMWGSNLRLAGNVRLTSFNFLAWEGSCMVTSGNVLITACQFSTGWSGDPLLVTGGHCSVVSSQAIGCDGAQTTTGVHSGTAGIRQTGGTLLIAHSTIRGGNFGWIYGTPGLSGSAALVVHGGRAYVVDSTVQGGQSGYYTAPGYSAIEAYAPVAHARCNLVPGSPLAAPTTGPVTANPNLLAIRSTGALNQGYTLQVEAKAGASGQPLLIAVSLDTGATLHPLAEQPVLGGGANLVIQTVAAAPANGSLVTASLAVPVNPALRGTLVTWQAFQGASPLVQASPMVGRAVF